MRQTRNSFWAKSSITIKITAQIVIFIFALVFAGFIAYVVMENCKSDKQDGKLICRILWSVLDRVATKFVSVLKFSSTVIRGMIPRGSLKFGMQLITSNVYFPFLHCLCWILNERWEKNCPCTMPFTFISDMYVRLIVLTRIGI